MQQESKTIKKIIGGVIALGVILGITTLATKEKTIDPDNIPPRQDTAPIDTTETQDDSTTTAAPVTTTQTNVQNVQSTQYTDGTYTATGTYLSPAGSESVSVTLTIQNDTVLSSTFTGNAPDGKSKQFQKQFADGYISHVIGKKLSDITVGKISGSSLTGKGFNDAVSQIKAQANI